MDKININLVNTISDYLRVDISSFDIDDIIFGMNVELEHGLINKTTNVTNDDMLLTFKLALAHLNIDKDYYKALAIMFETLKQNKLDQLLLFSKDIL